MTYETTVKSGLGMKRYVAIDDHWINLNGNAMRIDQIWVVSLSWIERLKLGIPSGRCSGSTWAASTSSSRSCMQAWAGTTGA